MIVYGPVPSRRLGQSVGINNIPPKTCSYSCVYCQIGRTNKMQIKRSEFYNPEDIFREAACKLAQLDSENRRADFFSFVPDGEPTLDLNLGKTIDLLRPLGIKIAVITNASTLWMDEVKEDLMKADWVSVSIDAADEPTWRKIDRPHGALDHREVLKGIMDFSKAFRGTLVTETMFVSGINDNEASAAAYKLLDSKQELEIISEMLIPALDLVGERFEKGEIFLPQLIRSADAAGAAFEVIKKHMAAKGSQTVSKGKIIIATVRGDIHDIGKNIVKTVLSNYGYRVIDLGRDVPPETIVEAAVSEDAKLVGLSALMTTTLPAMSETITALHKSGHDCRIMVGGAVLTPEYAAEIGAD